MKLETCVHKIIETEHTDHTGHLRLSGLLSLAQEAAVYAVEHDLELTPDKTFEKGIAWVVARYHFEISRLPVYEEECDIHTWQSKTLAFFFTRNFEFIDSKGDAFIKGSSAWTLIDKKSRQAILPQNYGLATPDVKTGREIPLPTFLRIDPKENVITLRSTYRDTDFNGHMNNVRYLDVCMDLIPLDFLNTHIPVSFDIAYKKEFRLGEETELRYEYKDGAYSFASDLFTLIIRFKEAV